MAEPKTTTEDWAEGAAAQKYVSRPHSVSDFILTPPLALMDTILKPRKDVVLAKLISSSPILTQSKTLLVCLYRRNAITRHGTMGNLLYPTAALLSFVGAG
jgi:hypothetical protein